MNNQVSWRVPIALQSLFAAISFTLMLLLPDTPRWYFSTGRMEKGDRVLEGLHDQPLDSEPVQRQKQEIMATIALESSHAKINILDLFWDRSRLKTGRRLRISFLILALQQNMGQRTVNIFIIWNIRANLSLQASMSWCTSARLFSRRLDYQLSINSFLQPL